MEPPPPPPTYEDATSRDWLVHVAHYVQPEDLFNCALVNKHWNAVFTHELWGEPHRTWANNNWSDYNRLKCFLLFLLELPVAHPQSLASVHSLDLSGLYGSLEAWGSSFSIPDDWLARILVYLPNLTSLRLCKALRVERASLEGWIEPHYNLQELNLASCDIGGENLAYVLARLPRLRTLNLKGVKTIKNRDALDELCKMRFINELRLRQTGLTDEVLEKIAKAMGTRLQTMDISSNNLTDKSVQALLDYCFEPPDYSAAVGVYTPASEPQSPFRQTGITSLAISNNWKIGHASLLNLLQSNRIREIDVGHFNLPPSEFFPASILPILEECCQTVTSLRIDFRLICATPDSQTKSIIYPRFQPSKFPSLERLVLEGVPYYLPFDYAFTSQLKELLLDLYSHSKTAPSPNLKDLVLEVAADEDPTWIPEDGSSVFPRFPSYTGRAPPPSTDAAESDSDDGGWSKVADFGEGGALEEFEGQDFSFFNEPYMRVPELREAASREARSPGARVRPRKESNAQSRGKVKRNTGLVDLRRETDKVVRGLRAEGKMWSGNVKFGKWDEEEMGSFI